MPEITVHVDQAQGLVAIEWPDRAGVTVLDAGGYRPDLDSGCEGRHTVPPFMTRLVDPTPVASASARPIETKEQAA